MNASNHLLPPDHRVRYETRVHRDRMLNTGIDYTLCSGRYSSRLCEILIRVMIRHHAAIQIRDSTYSLLQQLLREHLADCCQRLVGQ